MKKVVMKKVVMGGAAAVLLTAFAWAGSAEAQAPCWWNGYSWNCSGGTSSPMYYGYGSNWGNYAPYWYDYDYGSRPAWLPSYPGPKPSGGGGR